MEKVDQKKLEQFLQLIRSRALKFAASRCRDQDLALDLLQDTMIAFVEVAGNYPDEAWKNLFYKILNRRIVDKFRKNQWRNKLMNILNFSQVSTDDDELPSGIDTEDSESVYQADQLSEDFEQALQQLPERQKEAYLLRQWEQMSVKETAEVMGCSEGSVKTHLSRAMVSLKTSLGNWVDE